MGNLVLGEAFLARLIVRHVVMRTLRHWASKVFGDTAVIKRPSFGLVIQKANEVGHKYA